MTPNQPIGSISGIESLVMFGAQIFGQIFSLFHHPTAPVPVSAAPQMIATLNATPGTTPDHQTIIAAAVNAAASTVQPQ